MISKMIASLAIGFSLASCTTASTDNVVQGAPVAMTPEMTQAMQDVVKTQLKDPYSARFEGTKAATRTRNGTKEIVICGWVNAKNSFGGYTGNTNYIGVANQATRSFDIVAMGDQSSTAAIHVSAACRSAGIPI